MPSRIQRLQNMTIDQLVAAHVSASLRLRVAEISLKALTRQTAQAEGSFDAHSWEQYQEAIVYTSSRMREERTWLDAIEHTLAEIYPVTQHPRNCHCSRCYEE